MLVCGATQGFLLHRRNRYLLLYTWSKLMAAYVTFICAQRIFLQRMMANAETHVWSVF